MFSDSVWIAFLAAFGVGQYINDLEHLELIECKQKMHDRRITRLRLTLKCIYVSKIVYVSCVDNAKTIDHSMMEEISGEYWSSKFSMR